jgi:hypothetical protein
MSENNIIEIEDLEQECFGHVCPYCGHVELQINNHFVHIEIFHPEKPLL